MCIVISGAKIMGSPWPCARIFRFSIQVLQIQVRGKVILVSKNALDFV